MSKARITIPTRSSMETVHTTPIISSTLPETSKNMDKAHDMRHRYKGFGIQWRIFGIITCIIRRLLGVRVVTARLAEGGMDGGTSSCLIA